MSLHHDITIHGLSKEGDGIGRLDDGRVVFVERVLPGDRVRIVLGPLSKRVQRASLLEMLEPSPQRVPPQCHVERCGGCAIKGASQALQASHKKDAIVQALRRLGGLRIDPANVGVTQFGDGWHYRHRVRLHAAYMVGGWRLGYFERHSRTLVPLSMCPVAWPEVELLSLELARLLAPMPPEAAMVAVDVAFSRRDGRGAARLVTEGPMRCLRDDLSWFDRSGLGGVEIQAADGRLRYGNLQLRYDHQRADAFDLRYEPGLFTQACPAMNDALVDAVLDAVRPLRAPKVLELHAGIGNFSVPLARAGAKVCAVERDQRAAIMCQRNGRAPGLELAVIAASDAEIAPTVKDYDVVVADPPRTGMRAVAEVLAKQGPGRIVYISCDVATLARDAKILCELGPYTLSTVHAFDMFAQTPHVETLAVFETH